MPCDWDSYPSSPSSQPITKGSQYLGYLTISRTLLGQKEWAHHLPVPRFVSVFLRWGPLNGENSQIRWVKRIHELNWHEVGSFIGCSILFAYSSSHLTSTSLRMCFGESGTAALYRVMGGFWLVTQTGLGFGCSHYIVGVLRFVLASNIRIS